MTKIEIVKKLHKGMKKNQGYLEKLKLDIKKSKLLRKIEDSYKKLRFLKKTKQMYHKNRGC